MDDAFIRRLLVVAGVTATVFGCRGVVRGVDDVLGGAGPHRPEQADGWVANVDTEFRFFAAWYAAAGVQMIHRALATDAGRRDVGVLGVAWIAAATGRGLSVRSRGRPHALYAAFMAVEAVIGSILTTHGLRRAATSGAVGRSDGRR